jgi:hypothetical protein
MRIMKTIGVRPVTSSRGRSIGLRLAIAGIVVAAMSVASVRAREYESGIPWPEPKIVTPPSQPGGPPSDAIVLFDGKSLSQWEGGDKWIIKDGYAITAKGDIHTKQAFGNYQLHLEWAEPSKVVGSGQGRGNSGVYLGLFQNNGMYELQVLDSYQNTTYFDGQCGAIYKQHPPLVNVCRKPGEWQSYDVVFEAPRFDADGKLLRPAYVTALQNGVLVQNHFQLIGGTSWDQVPKYTAHAAKLPIGLQYHHNPVRYRNIWIREVPPSDAPPPAKKQ